MLEPGTKHHDMEQLFATTVEGIWLYHYCGTRSFPVDHTGRGAGETGWAGGGWEELLPRRRQNGRPRPPPPQETKKTTGLATTATNIDGNVPSNGFRDGGNQERTAPIAPSPTKTPPTGVR